MREFMQGVLKKCYITYENIFFSNINPLFLHPNSTEQYRTAQNELL